MKKMALALVALFVMAIQASAMSYEQAREQALFLTDKMAYELNLTDDQYEAAYEINLDYLMGVNHQSDLYGPYWTRRNTDLSYVLLDWQYRMFLDASYFYRPLYWDAGYWHFGIYARYPHRDYFYFGRPHFYVSYRGGHAWHHNGGHSWYHGRQFGGPHGGRPRVGMRDGFDRGDFGRGGRLPAPGRNNMGNRRDNQMQPGGNRSFGNGNRGGKRGDMRRNPSNDRRGNMQPNGSTRTFGGNTGQQPRSRMGNDSRESSTRTTATRQGGTRTFGSPSQSSSPRSTFTPSKSNSRTFGGSSSAPARSSSSMSAPSRGASSAPSRSFGSSPSTRSSGGGHSGGSRSGGGHFGGRH